MRHIEKTVFISYRRTNAPWALAIFQSLTSKGYDVFFDFQGIASGDFERVIIENIKARAHFIVLLTPSALERCGEPGDWLRREIETALEAQRNLVPLMLDSFHFDTPAIADQLTGKLAALKRYNALRVPTEYFLEAMTRLCEKHLNVPLDAVLHPASSFAQQAAKEQQTAASAVPEVLPKKLTDTLPQGFPITAKDPPGSVPEFQEMLPDDVTGTATPVIETPQPKPPAASDTAALPDPAYSPATAAPADNKGAAGIYILILLGTVIVALWGNGVF